MSMFQRELVDILKANHLSTEKGVAKKAQTIMRQVDAGGVGMLSMDEFMVVANKFPNLVRVVIQRRILFCAVCFAVCLFLKEPPTSISIGSE